MNNKPIEVEVVFTANGKLKVSKPQMKQFEVWNLNTQQDNRNIQKLFNNLANKTIIKCFIKDKNRIMHIKTNKNVIYRVTLRDYNKLLNVIKCYKLDKKMNQYWIKKGIKKINEKLNVKIENFIEKVPNQFIVAGSLLTATIMIPSIISSNNEVNVSVPNINDTAITQEVTLEEKDIKESEIIINQNEISDDNTLQNNSLDSDKDNPNEMVTNKIEINSNTDDIEILEIDENNFENSNHELSFSNLATFNTIDQYVAFASNLYGVDIETSKKLLSDKVNNMEYYINNSNNTELKNLYELKNLGVINGDLDVMGTFIIIKNYAIDNLGITNQEPIISNKTANEKEKDMIDIARYIYGIENNDLLNNMVAIHRLETGNGESEYATKLNNFGGNMNANPSQEQINRFVRIIQPEALDIKNNPIPNIYKTAEIGEESMVRNFLNVYSKCLHDEECIGKNNIADFLSKKYCTHTPENWAIAVNNILDEGTIQETVEEYIDNNNKTL